MKLNCDLYNLLTPLVSYCKWNLKYNYLGLYTEMPLLLLAFAEREITDKLQWG
jgi:hypothetical protein